MNYVTLGKTGLKAAVVSFGGIPIQRADGANTKAVVDKLEEYGINYIGLMFVIDLRFWKQIED